MIVEDLIYKIRVQIYVYESKNIKTEDVVIAISENNIKMIIEYVSGTTNIVYSSLRLFGRRIVSSEMLTDNEILIGEISKLEQN